MRAFATGKLAHYKIPRYVLVVDEFPMTVTGKIRKVQMREETAAQLGLGWAGSRGHLTRRVAGWLPVSTRTGLVLGGGGVTGIAWEIGLLAGLRDGGADVSGADLVIGTSAGSVVGALLASGDDLDDLYAEQTEPAPDETRRRVRHARRGSPCSG